VKLDHHAKVCTGSSLPVKSDARKGRVRPQNYVNHYAVEPFIPVDLVEGAASPFDLADDRRHFLPAGSVRTGWIMLPRFR
jgi:hypothetical protein